jgi:hypothetical protein
MSIALTDFGVGRSWKVLTRSCASSARLRGESGVSGLSAGSSNALEVGLSLDTGLAWGCTCATAVKPISNRVKEIAPTNRSMTLFTPYDTTHTRYLFQSTVRLLGYPEIVLKPIHTLVMH